MLCVRPLARTAVAVIDTGELEFGLYEALYLCGPKGVIGRA